MISAVIMWGAFLGLLYYLNDSDKLNTVGAFLLAAVALANAILFFL